MLLSVTALKSQNLISDLQKVTDYVSNNKAITLQIDVEVKQSDGKNLRYTGKVVKYDEVYFTEFQGRSMLNTPDYNLQIDNNNKMVFIRDNVAESDYFNRKSIMMEDVSDSIMENHEKDLPKRQILGNGHIMYQYVDEDLGRTTEIVLNGNQIVKLTYVDTYDQGFTSTTIIKYQYKSAISTSDQTKLNLENYVEIKRKKKVSLTPKYSSYELVNNLTL